MSERQSRASTFAVMSFMAIFFLVGLAGFGGFLYLLKEEYRVQYVYLPTACRILSKKLVSSEDSDGAKAYRPEFVFQHELLGRTLLHTGYSSFNVNTSNLSAEQEILDQFEVGRNYPCWYDPKRPEVAVLSRRLSPMLLFILLPLLFMIIAVSVMRSTLRKRLVSPEALALEEQSAQRPAPSSVNLLGKGASTSSVGAGLRRPNQLKNRKSRLGELVGLGFGTVFWNLIVLIVFWVVRGAKGGAFIGMMIFLIPFGIGGVALTVVLVRRFILYFRIREIVVRLDSGTLLPGSRTPGSLRLEGRLEFNNLIVTVRCHERIEYSAGTDTYREVHKAYEQVLISSGSFSLSAQQPWERRFEVEIPKGAMHSFVAKHNQITWDIHLKGDVKNGPDFEYEFEFQVAHSLPELGG